MRTELHSEAACEREEPLSRSIMRLAGEAEKKMGKESLVHCLTACTACLPDEGKRHVRERHTHTHTEDANREEMKAEHHRHEDARQQKQSSKQRRRGRGASNGKRRMGPEAQSRSSAIVDQSAVHAVPRTHAVHLTCAGERAERFSDTDVPRLALASISASVRVQSSPWEKYASGAERKRSACRADASRG